MRYLDGGIPEETAACLVFNLGEGGTIEGGVVWLRGLGELRERA